MRYPAGHRSFLIHAHAICAIAALYFQSPEVFSQELDPYAFTLQDGQWEQLSIPADSGTKTISDLFADDLPIEEYGSGWAVFIYDGSVGEYTNPGLGGTLSAGTGFWMLQLTGSPVEIDVPSALADAALSQSPACPAIDGCFRKPLAVGNAEKTWTMFGAPFTQSTNLDDLHVETVGVDSLCVDGCDLDEADTNGYSEPNIWRYDHTTDEYVDLRDIGLLGTMEGAWVATKPASQTIQPALLISDPDDLLGPQPPAIFQATRKLITSGQSTQLSWNSPRADTVTIEPEIGVVERSGQISISPTQTTEYRLTATRGASTNVIALTITVQPLAAVSIQANVAQGLSPLAVRFSPVLDSTTAINRVYWDFEGDGGPVDGGLGVGEQGFDFIFGFRQFDATGRDIPYTFNFSGTYSTRARVWDVNNNQSDAALTITVENGPPDATVSASPTLGQIPLRVQFSASASDGDGIGGYEWDFDGDGIFDAETRFGRASHTYETTGEFRPTVRVTDSLGAFVDLQPPNIAVSAVTTPVLALTSQIFPSSGQAPLPTQLFAFVTSTDPDISWAWDFEGDGEVDSTEGAFVRHSFEVPGTYYPVVTATDSSGNVGRSVLSVVVGGDPLALSVENGAIDPEAGETATITLSPGQPTVLDLFVENGSGATVKTLVADETVAGDPQSYTWDGRDDAGNIAPPGDYYVIAHTGTGDDATTIDLRDSTAGFIFYPNDGSVGQTCENRIECGVLTISDNPLAPFSGEPVEFEYQLTRNAKAVAYVTVRGSENFSPATFFRGKMIAAGDYNIRWFADGTDGTILPSRPRNRGYVPAIFGQTAGDNSIFLTHTTEIENLSVSPPIFHPNLVPGRGGNEVTFDLNRDADILMRVDSTEAGVEVFRTIFPSVTAGAARTIQWDGRNNEGQTVAPGGYRISITAQDEFGQESFTLRELQRVRY